MAVLCWARMKVVGMRRRNRKTLVEMMMHFREGVVENNLFQDFLLDKELSFPEL
jgi:hypothetical protein